MRVSDRLTHGFWTLGMACAAALMFIPGQSFGQIVSAANDYGSSATTAEPADQQPPATGDYMQWLAAAKQAMGQQQLDLADHYLRLSEELYRQAGSPVGPNPHSVRNQLNQLLAAQSQPGTVEPMSQANANADPTATALQALHNARTALAHSDVDVAQQMVQLAKSYSVDYAKLGDSPVIIESMIGYQNELSALAKARDAAFNSKAASFLLQQAQALVSYRDFETAEMLVVQAKKFPVEFNQQTGSPDSVMASINAARDAFVTQQAQQTTAKAQLDQLMSKAQLAFDKNDLALAKSFANQARNLNLPDSAFENGEMRPWQLELKIQDAMKIGGGVMPASYQKVDNQGVIQADYYPDRDTTRNVTVSMSDTKSTDIDDRLAKFPEFNPIPSRGMQLFRSGLQALDAKDHDGAREYFQMAWQYREQLDQTTQQSIQDNLTRLARNTSAALQDPDEEGNPVDQESFSPLDQKTDGSADVDENGDLDIADQGNTASKAKPDDSDSEVTFESDADRADSKPADPAAAAKRKPRDLDETQEQTTFRQLQAEVFKQRAAAERLLTKNPREALEKMTLVRSRVSQSELELESKRPLLTIIDRDIKEMQGYIEQNLPDIINQETNAQRIEDVELRRQHRYEVEQQIQNLVEDFNKLLDQQRYAEAEMVARQAVALDPESEISSLMSEKARMAIRIDQMEQIQKKKENGVWNNLARTDESSALMDERVPLTFIDRDEWARKTSLRAERLGLSQYDSEAERRIWNLLKNEMVQGDYQGTLLDAVDQLSRQAGVNIIFDMSAMAAEGVQTDRTVNVPIREPISLQSALNVVLGTAGLVFVVEDEVIKVTSRDAQRKDVKTKTYYIGDLVTPIKNFNSSLNMNFMSPGATYGQNGLIGQDFGGQIPLSANRASPTSINPVVAAQQSQAAMAQQMPGIPFGNGFPVGYGGGGPQTGTPTYNSIGPQSPGGVTEADFEPLIDLIKSTIDAEGWDDTNGDGTIQAYVPNLSLIVSQTQEVQDQIQDLLQKLRELNDVQIVVEVRFIILRDDFFERIGVDFDFRLNDNSGLGAGPIPDEVNPSVIIGREPLGGTFQPTGDLDLAFRQDSFTSAIPQFGGFDASSAANFGFAILSDIEVFFLIQAAKGDQRSNILNAPTVTMFNGQSASVIDASLRPFVTSVIPVVGDFAVAQQPVVTLLPDGTSLNVNAVVSNDRKFVRMTLVPFFSQVTDVQTFTFDGSKTTRRASDSLLDDLINQVNGNANDPNADNNVDLETVEEGVTIQLPTLAATTISTVVSVPDGGTVMLGGIKRMSEGRTERGVPFLSNIPYVNRLFKNVGIGRETDNLMMMVTPRIIIQEEEEAAQVGSAGGN